MPTAVREQQLPVCCHLAAVLRSLGVKGLGFVACLQVVVCTVLLALGLIQIPELGRPLWPSDIQWTSRLLRSRVAGSY